MKISRNDPCPCGSGKKYKKCCMQKDEEARRVQRIEEQLENEKPIEAQPEGQRQRPEDEVLPEFSLTAESEPSAKAAKAKNPHTKALDARWQEFEAQDYDDQIAVFLKTLEEPDLMDDQMAFEMLDTIHGTTKEPEQRNRYDALVEQLHERMPKIYAKNAHFYLQNRITNEVIAGRFDQIPALLNELAQRAGKNIDIFNMVVEQLAYHGQLAALVQAFQIAWPAVEKSRDIVPWGIDEFSGRSTQYLVFDYVERFGGDPEGHAELFERIKPYSEVKPERITKFLALLSGQSGRQWVREDFTFKAKSRSRDDGGPAIDIPKTVQQNLFDMSLDFQGYLRRERNMALTKSELGREQLVDYFIQRLAGDLEPRKSMLEAALSPNKPGPKKRHPKSYLSGDDDSVHWLCPDRKSLDAFIAKLFGFLMPQPYKAAALFEMIPAWLRFLESHQLISAAAHLQSLRDLRALAPDLLKILRKTESDPAPQLAIENWEVEAQLDGAS